MYCRMFLHIAVIYVPAFYFTTEDMGYVEVCAVISSEPSEASENFTVSIYLEEGTNDCSV